eukprot:GHVP01015065.1.p1 GENE.GHVP01015065.1~~GHVP01015065.1.p1  ORF type:complete len:153 (+),score=24.66 GHVP01015065.1:50-508(+)
MQPNFLEGAFPIAFHPALNHEEDWTKIIGSFQNEAFQDELHFGLVKYTYSYQGSVPRKSLIGLTSRRSRLIEVLKIFGGLITVVCLYVAYKEFQFLFKDNSCTCTRNDEISKKFDEQEKSFAEEVAAKITSEVISRAVVNALSERESQRTDY